MKTNKIIFYVSTGLLTAIMIFSVSNYFFNYEMISGAFESFGYPTYIIYPYAVLKILGTIVLWLPGLKILKEWVYAGFLYAFVLAFFAHYMIEDGQHGVAVLAIIALILSYVFYKKINK